MSVDTHPTFVCVLGMHRSGTSCLSGCLEERGLHLGEVVNKAAHNLKGNKENLEFRQINDDILVLSGGAWDRPPTHLVWNDDLRRRRDAYIDSHALVGMWGAKDPRAMLTLPFWEEADVNMRLVGTFRHPAAVAMSLDSRPGLKPATPSLDLWSDYNKALLDYVQTRTVDLVCFDWDDAQYLKRVDEMARSLGLGTTEQPDALEFFETGFRHHRADALADMDGVDAHLPLYEALLALT